MSCFISIEENLCKEEKFQLQSMSNAITCIDERLVKNSGLSLIILSGFDIQLEKSYNDNLACQKSVQGHGC